MVVKIASRRGSCHTESALDRVPAPKASICCGVVHTEGTTPLEGESHPLPAVKNQPDACSTPDALFGVVFSSTGQKRRRPVLAELLLLTLRVRVRVRIGVRIGVM
jgi:hypothetical protein